MGFTRGVGGWGKEPMTHLAFFLDSSTRSMLLELRPKASQRTVHGHRNILLMECPEKRWPTKILPWQEQGSQGVRVCICTFLWAAAQHVTYTATSTL